MSSLPKLKRQAMRAEKAFSADSVTVCIAQFWEQGTATMPSSRVYSFVLTAGIANISVFFVVSRVFLSQG